MASAKSSHQQPSTLEGSRLLRCRGRASLGGSRGLMPTSLGRRSPQNGALNLACSATVNVHWPAELAVELDFAGLATNNAMLLLLATRTCVGRICKLNMAPREGRVAKLASERATGTQAARASR